MLINKANLDELFFNLKRTYDRQWEDTEAQWPKIAMRIESMSARNEYKWLSKFPRMREWIGEKTIKQFEGFDYTIVNKDWEATVEVDRNDIEDDNLNIYAPQARMAGYSAKRFPDEIVFALVNNGFADKGYDGKAFFATNHPVGKNAVSNKGTKALAGDTLEKAKASFGAARTALRNLVDWLLLYIPRARWMVRGIGPAEELRARNLYSKAVDQDNLALAEVSWRQTVRLESEGEMDCPALPAELYASPQQDPHEQLYPEAA